MSTSNASTAGRGDPYWYEWFVGVIEVLNFLDPASEVQSVAFQAPGVKGWDDVVVKLRSGGRRCYQVKHTRVEDTLTFGDLVRLDGKQPSLLGSLFASWMSSGLNDGSTRFILYTNRVAGARTSTADSVKRPPLAAFMAWLAISLPNATQITDLVPDMEWQDAWAEWSLQLNGSETDQLDFLRSFQILTRQDDLEGLVTRVTNVFARAFGVSAQRVHQLVDSLHRALRKWTTGHTEVTAEDFYSDLALEAQQKDLALAPPPPAPFFPNRIPIALELEGDLTVPTNQSVFFLSAEPGAGKTSVLSWLANRRNSVPFMGTIGLRFFCFEPIRPEAPFIAPDASRVHPSDLWFSLLTQLREGLRGRLRELCVPLRNDLLTWQEARVHVIRLASTLGTEIARPFVIVIDGIDHAARAAQTIPQQSKEFFESLPGPDELRGKSIRLLLAGQPAVSYSEQYPSWLVCSHPEVRKIELPGLQDNDVRSLVQAVRSIIPPEQLEAVVRLIQQVANGNTLATVFAVAETEKVASLDELASLLAERRLNDGLAHYYSSIWQHALRNLADRTEGIGACLMASLSLARGGVTPEFLSDAFGEWERPVVWWATVLEDLGPLLTAGPDGYRVRYNDVRVFLASRFVALPITRRNRVASQLADHYRSEHCDRVAAHHQLLDLLKLIEQPEDFSRVFDVSWVIEAGALGIETAKLLEECEAAIQGLAQLRVWSLVVSVASAAQTLERLVEAREHADYLAYDHDELPPFLPSEARVLALSQWSLQHLRSLVHDAERLVAANERPRALALLQRWLVGLDLGEIVVLPDIGLTDPHEPSSSEARISQEAVSVFETLGRLCGRLGWVLPPGQSTSSLYVPALIAFERGYVAAALESEAATLSKLFANYEPIYISSWVSALRGLAGSDRWVLVRETLGSLESSRLSFSAPLRAEVTAWALRSRAAQDEPAWLEPLNLSSYGIDPEQLRGSDPQETIAPYLSIAYAIGWTRVGVDGHDIANSVYEHFAPRKRYGEWEAPVRAIFRASALLGRADSAFARGAIRKFATC